MKRKKPRMFRQVISGVYLFKDSCNVYLIKQDGRAIAFDFGSGGWMESLSQIGVSSLDHVFLTHAHRDQCYGLSERPDWPFEIHASPDDQRFYKPTPLKDFWKSYQSVGCPANYLAPRHPLPSVRGDVGEAREIQWSGLTIASIPTPGHTPGAVSFIAELNGKSIAFCGDAVHAGATLHEPYHLEWDHWTPGGALTAWYGLERLSYCRIDMLCPSHGPSIRTKPSAVVRRLQRRIRKLIRAKGSVCAGEPDRWVPVERIGEEASRVLPNLYAFGGNSYLLTDGTDGFVIDPTLPGVKSIVPFMKKLRVRTLSAATATHFHLDHSDGLNWLRDRFGTKVWLHPWVAEPIVNRDRYDVPWLPVDSIPADRLLPEEGRFRWRRYELEIRPFPGQTWWHCAFDTEIDGTRELFSGDNFQPATRWNGTGGFCSFNGSRFKEGFARSASTVLELEPDLVCNGHGVVYAYNPSHYQRILKWSNQSETTLRELSPSANWLQNYDHRKFAWTPFRSTAKAGSKLHLSLKLFNHTSRPYKVTVTPADWRSSPERRSVTVPGDASRLLAFTFSVPRNAKPGRHVLAARIEVDGQNIGEPAAALVDVE